MNTFKCWLIANFEIAMPFLTLLIGSIVVWIFGANIVAMPDNEFGTKGEVWLMFAMVVGFILLLSIPTNRGTLQFGKYILMWGGIIYFVWFYKENPLGGEALTETQIALYEHIRMWFWIIFSVVSAISGYLAFYTFVNFDEVTSRRMLWRNSNVSLFEISMLYTLDRFCNISVSLLVNVFCLVGLFMLI
jgi:hypothetical protein